MGYEDKERKKALDAAVLAYRVRKRTPEAWERMQALAAEDYAAGIHMSAKFYIEVVRRKLAVKKSEDAYALNNNTTPAFARMLLMEHPEYRYPDCPHGLRVRESRMDEVFGDALRLACAEAVGSDAE